MAGNIFTIDPVHFERLDAREAVDFFRALLWAEARRLKIPSTKIHVSLRTDVPDGGIDASLIDCELPTDSGLFPALRTGYQIKASSAFKPQQEAQLRKELFGEKKEVKRDNLGDSVRDCLDTGGTYVLVCFKQDFVETERSSAETLLRNLFLACDYTDPKVAVWGQSELTGALQPFPSLQLRLKGITDIEFITHETWAEQPEMRREFQVGTDNAELIENVRTELTRDDEAVLVHLWGEAGVGKTRLVLEATRAEDIEPLVLYCTATKFIESNLFRELLLRDNTYSVVLVVDECDARNRTYIWGTFKNIGARIKIITIYNEYDTTSGTISYFEVPPLPSEEISRIIQDYDIPPEQATRWAALCSGSPRVAHVVGWNLKNNPEDILRPLDTVDIWERYIVGGDDPRSDEVRQRRLVLQYIALFKRFGFERQVMEEAKRIAALVQDDNPQVTWAQFQRIVQELRDRKILQGEYTLYLTPKLLHIKLWVDWWDTFSRGFNWTTFSEQLPAELLEWFYEMFEYAANSDAAIRIVRELLGPSGPFEKDEYLKTRLGGRFFLALTNADPGAALRCLVRTIGNWSPEELISFKEGRREVIYALERIVVWDEYFVDAARLLLRLAEAENEKYSNNASGIFVDLFSPGWGAVAPTEAPPQKRLPVLIEALTSQSSVQHELAFRAIGKALETDHFYRTVGAEHQGLRREPKLWTPKTWGELFDYYRQVWEALYKELDNLPVEEQTHATTILINNALGVGRIHAIADLVVDTLYELLKRPYVNREAMLETVIRMLRSGSKDLPPEVRAKWEQLKEHLTGSDFTSLLKRYVGTDLLEDKFDDEGNYVDQKQAKIEELAQQAIEDFSILQPELSWIVRAGTEAAFTFGYELGVRDAKWSLLVPILKEHIESDVFNNVLFLGGYLRSTFLRSEEGWESVMDVLAEMPHFNALIPELTWRSRGITEKATERITRLLDEGIIGANHLRVFLFGGVAREVPEKTFTKWIEFLLNDDMAGSVDLALNLFYTGYINDERKENLPEDLTYKLITHPSIYTDKDAKLRKNRQKEDWYWGGIAKRYARQYPSRSLDIAALILENLGADNTIFDTYRGAPYEVLGIATEQHPREMWRLVTKYIGPPIDSRAWRIKNWLQGEGFASETDVTDGALSEIPIEEVWEWIDEDVENRAGYAATFIPKIWDRGQGKLNIAREFLVRYGTREDVRHNLAAAFSSDMWMGSAVTHYQNKKETWLRNRQGETNPVVLRWIDDFISDIDHAVEDAKIREERMF